MPITLLAYSMVAGYAAFMVFFIPNICQAKEAEEKPAVEENKEQPVEEIQE